MLLAFRLFFAFATRNLFNDDDVFESYLYNSDGFESNSRKECIVCVKTY